MEKQLEDAENVAAAQNRAAQRYMSPGNGLYQDYSGEEGVKSQPDEGNAEGQEDSDISDVTEESTEEELASMEDFQDTAAGQENDTDKTVIENLESQIEFLNSSINMAETEKNRHFQSFRNPSLQVLNS